MKNNWTRSCIFSMFILLVFSAYVYIRQGEYDLSAFNKVLGLSAALIAGVTLLMGPMSRVIPSLAAYNPLRQHLGDIAYILAIAHLAASLIQQNRFPFPAWYLAEVYPVIFGFLALGTWTYIKYISSDSHIKKLGKEMWANRLSIGGKLGFFFIFLHVAVMKYEGWIRWIQGDTQASYPPSSLVLFILMLMIIVYRIYTDYLKTYSQGTS